MYAERRGAKDDATRERVNARISNVKEAVKLYGGRFVTPMTLDIAPGTVTALDTARRVGNPLIVGGAVRDASFGAENKDIDIEVHGAEMDKLVSAFRSDGFNVDEVGKQFGVLKVSKRGVVSDLDISVPRRENAVGAGHRGFEVTTDKNMTVTEAASRRDFTLNAMMYDQRLGVLVDPFNGKADLEHGILRHVGPAFSEDPLRVLRGVQFAGRFNMKLAPETATLCKNLRPRYEELAKERVAEEWTKLWSKGRDAGAAMTALRDSGWDTTIDGLADAAADPRTTEALSNLGDVSSDMRASAGSAAVARYMPADKRDDFIRTTTVGGDTAKLARTLVGTDPAALDTPYARKRFALDTVKSGWTFDKYRQYAEMVGDTDGVRAAKAGIRDGLADAPEPPIVQGRDVISVAGGRKPGPWVGELVARALDEQYRGNLADKESAVEWLKLQLRSMTG